MSASPGPDGPPTPDELVQRFDITADQAQTIADAMEPLQDLTGIGDSIGSALEGAPGAGYPFIGAVLQNIALQVNMVSQSAEVMARAIHFYAEAQGGAVSDLFPPPHVLAGQLQEDFEPARDAARDFSR